MNFKCRLPNVHLLFPCIMKHSQTYEEYLLLSFKLIVSKYVRNLFTVWSHGLVKQANGLCNLLSQLCERNLPRIT